MSNKKNVHVHSIVFPEELELAIRDFCKPEHRSFSNQVIVLLDEAVKGRQKKTRHNGKLAGMMNTV